MCSCNFNCAQNARPHWHIVVFRLRRSWKGFGWRTLTQKRTDSENGAFTPKMTSQDSGNGERLFTKYRPSILWHDSDRSELQCVTGV